MEKHRPPIAYSAPGVKSMGNESIVLEGLGENIDPSEWLGAVQQGRQRAKVLPHLVQRIARFSSSADYGASLSLLRWTPVRTDPPPARRTRRRHRCKCRLQRAAPLHLSSNQLIRRVLLLLRYRRVRPLPSFDAAA